ncbi:hypothetical protein BDZ85DRAFT_41735 [Elsinoe ampelina]|uniref:Uncharacterized protein n=1 Tax=Elsinoe ampelina TaxID=302913 RepID=A0A6A6G1C1_9PEZI|nr:hypothetical protein BDZ85DRAFT_41735 [Elsinoe ampelina]
MHTLHSFFRLLTHITPPLSTSWTIPFVMSGSGVPPDRSYRPMGPGNFFAKHETHVTSVINLQDPPPLPRKLTRTYRMTRPFVPMTPSELQSDANTPADTTRVDTALTSGSLRSHNVHQELQRPRGPLIQTIIRPQPPGSRKATDSTPVRSRKSARTPYISRGQRYPDVDEPVPDDVLRSHGLNPFHFRNPEAADVAQILLRNGFESPAPTPTPHFARFLQQCQDEENSTASQDQAPSRQAMEEPDSIANHQVLRQHPLRSSHPFKDYYCIEQADLYFAYKYQGIIMYCNEIWEHDHRTPVGPPEEGWKTQGLEEEREKAIKKMITSVAVYDDEFLDYAMQGKVDKYIYGRPGQASCLPDSPPDDISAEGHVRPETYVVLVIGDKGAVHSIGEMRRLVENIKGYCTDVVFEKDRLEGEVQAPPQEFVDYIKGIDRAIDMRNERERCPPLTAADDLVAQDITPRRYLTRQSDVKAATQWADSMIQYLDKLQTELGMTSTDPFPRTMAHVGYTNNGIATRASHFAHTSSSPLLDLFEATSVYLFGQKYRMRYHTLRLVHDRDLAGVHQHLDRVILASYVHLGGLDAGSGGNADVLALEVAQGAFDDALRWYIGNGYEERLNTQFKRAARDLAVAEVYQVTQDLVADLVERENGNGDGAPVDQAALERRHLVTSTIVDALIEWDRGRYE